MWQKRPRLAILALLPFCTLSCLNSPVLDHEIAPDPRNPEVRAEEDARSCPLTFSLSGTCASLQWDRMPSEEEGGEFTLRFWSSTDGTQNGPYQDPPQSLGVKLWMPSMGHGSSPVNITHAKDSAGLDVPGVFRATGVYFVMSGKWEIWVQLKEGSKVLDQAKIDIEN